MTGNAAPSSPRNNSTSLRRALGILLLLGEDAADTRGATLTELADRLDLNKSTLLRLLAPLREASLIEQDPETGRYRLGWRTAQLGHSYLDRLDLRTAAHDVLNRLMIDTSETTHLVIPDLPDLIYVDKVEAAQPVRMYSRIGSRQPAYCTAAGKALLAHAGEAAVRLVIEHGLPGRTPNTRTTAEELRAELAAVLERGYGIDDIENEPDIRCVGAAIFDHSGAPACAISVSGPASRITRDRVPELGRLVVAAAEEISRRLGGPPRQPPRPSGKSRAEPLTIARA
jgi:DNA-binding IclR family transcriptional regulator